MDLASLEKMVETADLIHECLEGIHENPTVAQNRAFTLELQLHASYLKGKIEQLVTERRITTTTPTTGREL